MRVLDASFSALPPGWAAARKAEGYGAFIQCLWPGGYANRITTAEGNLRQAREAGLIPCGYINTNPWFPSGVSIAEAKKNAGAEWAHLPVVFNDIEITGVTEAHCKAHTDAVVAEGKRTAIYSAKWFWDTLGNPQWPWLKQHGVWVADYDGDPNIATSRLFGPWTLADVVGKQYTNTTDIGGVSVDINEFRDNFFQAPGQAPEEDDMPKMRFVRGANSGTIWATDGVFKMGITSDQIRVDLENLGLAEPGVRPVADEFITWLIDADIIENGALRAGLGAPALDPAAVIDELKSRL